eukprot:TRINITY_DN1185_c0_g1_i1.p1 TRINITY_DN1185_c0_g1~~TRINITY_DN1185_c0_g1_i1.p1  ORF type:complete len:314 (+),score=93.31 TRINITY_DN1185_c0_g1_i1:79-1020(+)
MSEHKVPMTTFPTGKDIPAQTQKIQPGLECKMEPRPVISQLESFDENGNPYSYEYKGSGKLKGKRALITGGDSGIGRSAGVMFAREGADVAFTYVKGIEEPDMEETKKLIEKEGVKAFPIAVDYDSYGEDKTSEEIIEKYIAEFKVLDILVNNASEQHMCGDITKIDAKQVEKTFKTNIIAMILISKYAVKQMKKGSCIINSSSVTGYKGSVGLIDYSSTKGAIVSFTKSLASQLAPKGIRVNAVAPGPVWTAIQVSSRDAEDVEGYGDGKCPIGRVGQPAECGGSYVFLASGDSSFFTGQVLHPNGGYYMCS